MLLAAPEAELREQRSQSNPFIPRALNVNYVCLFFPISVNIFH